MVVNDGVADHQHGKTTAGYWDHFIAGAETSQLHHPRPTQATHNRLHKFEVMLESVPLPLEGDII